ncbi:MAG TPA: DUF4177 domain-containing protein [Rhodanobacteraceae bacterium]|jgi:hypothetical protein|nr:DUF4177 domain-containing protein [Rhodanobacteraceae bacterium]
MNTETRWTYKVVRFKPANFFKLRNPDPDEVAEQLNQLGRDGWELVHVVEGYGVPLPVFYLKKPG